jgi:hypothetical protein
MKKIFLFFIETFKDSIYEKLPYSLPMRIFLILLSSYVTLGLGRSLMQTYRGETSYEVVKHSSKPIYINISALDESGFIQIVVYIVLFGLLSLYLLVELLNFSRAIWKKFVK